MQNEVEQNLFDSAIALSPMKAEELRVNEDTLPHYCGSLLLEIPLGKYLGVKSFGRYTYQTAEGEKQIDKIQPFVLIPITNSSEEGPAEAIPQGIPDRDKPEAFNPRALNNGVQTVFNFTAKQNAQKLISEMGGNGCFIWHTLTGRRDAAEIYNVVLPINNLDFFPRVTRTYRATTRQGIFLDQVENYLKTKAEKVIKDNQSLSPEQKQIAWKFYEEYYNAVGRANIFCSGQVERISAEISKGIRTPFSFAKETADAPYPFDFMILAHLNMEEPSVSRPITSKMQDKQANDDLLKTIAEGQLQMQQFMTMQAQWMQMMMSNGMQMPQGMTLPQIPQTDAPKETPKEEIEQIANAPVFFDEVDQDQSSDVSDELFGAAENIEKPKKVLTSEQKAAMAEGRRKAQEAKVAA